MEEKIINFQELLYALKKRFKIIIIAIVGVTVLSAIYANYNMHESYQARVKIFAGKTEEIQGSYSTSELDTYSDLMATYIQLIKTEDFMNTIIDKVGLDVSATSLMNGIVFMPSTGTPILDIRYTSYSPDIARVVIETLTEEFDKQVSEVILNTYTVVIDSVKVDTIVPDKTKVVMMGFAAGVILGLGLALILDYFDDTLVRREELERIIPVPVLGEISLVKDEYLAPKKNNKKG